MATEAGPHADAVTRIVTTALGLPAELVGILADLVETIAESHDVAQAIDRAKQNALADTEDAAAEGAADAILKGRHK